MFIYFCIAFSPFYSSPYSRDFFREEPEEDVLYFLDNVFMLPFIHSMDEDGILMNRYRLDIVVVVEEERERIENREKKRKSKKSKKKKENIYIYIYM